MRKGAGLTKSIAEDPAVLRIIRAARDFCDLVEKKHRSKRRFVEQALRSTTAVYAAGLDLPDARPSRTPVSREQRDREVRASGERFEYIWKRIAANLQEKEIGLLVDDLSDIYGDLQRGLTKLREDPDLNSNGVIWEWKLMLQTHWGRHAVNALDRLHALAYETPNPSACGQPSDAD